MTTEKVSGVRAKLAAHKAANAGTYDVTLGESGIVCSIPKFINHGIWMKAQRIGKGDNPKTQAAYIVETVLFDGEKLNMTELAELVPAGDSLQLIGELFGDDDDDKKTDEGNGTVATA